ncbi:MAG TPA: transketolase, partial [Alphaproteobacteria bacterium]|nr:transketolase [Alphaproteobacteria bacterium]
EACGWHTITVNGHDPVEINRAITQAKNSTKPTLIACRTIIGFGAPKKAGTAATHGSPLGSEEITGARAKLGWNYPAFVVPEYIR